MKWWAGIVLGLGLIGSGGAFLACYSKVCAPNDTSCLPCNDPRQTNDACLAPPSDQPPSWYLNGATPNDGGPR